MKIIGSKKDGFILEASETEVANLVGYYSEYEMARSKDVKELKVGDDIKVHEMYRRLYVLSRRRGEIKTAQKMLRDAASELELVDPILEASDQPIAMEE